MYCEFPCFQGKKQKKTNKHVPVRTEESFRIHVKMAFKVYLTRRLILSIFFFVIHSASTRNILRLINIGRAVRIAGIRSSLFHFGSQEIGKNRYNERRNVMLRLLRASPAGASAAGVRYSNQSILKIFTGSNIRLGLIIIRRKERSISQGLPTRTLFCNVLKRMKS